MRNVKVDLLDTKLFQPVTRHNALITGRNLKTHYYVDITPEAADVWRRYGFTVTWLRESGVFFSMERVDSYGK